MKKTLLFVAAALFGYTAQAQVVVAGVSPAAVQGNYDFGIQANYGGFPGQTDDGTWGTWSGGLDFTNPGDYIQDTLMLVDDGTPGLNPQGNPIAEEGCNALLNDLTGKIAVVYRNSCFFSSKVHYAEQAGAIGVIVINREDAIINMSANTSTANGPLGTDCHIPAVSISSIDGAAIVAAMDNGPVVMFIGNKIGAFTNDLGSDKGNILTSPYRVTSNRIDNGFGVGLQVYNHGTADQTNVSVTANIDGPSGNVYNEVVSGLAIPAGDTMAIVDGFTNSFPAFDLGMGNYPNGDYTLTYTLDIGGTDDFNFDNEFTSTFSVTDDYISTAKNDASGMPTASSYPMSATIPSDYQSCIFFQSPQAGSIDITGLSFVADADTANPNVQFGGTELNAIVYQWDDAWTDLNDAAYFGQNATQDPFALVESNVKGYATYYPASNDDVKVPALVNFDDPVVLENDVRYLVCMQRFDTSVTFGYDGAINYDGNQLIRAMPVSPIKALDGNGAARWYSGGWNSLSAPSITLHVQQTTVGINDITEVDGMVFPNPAKDQVTINVEAEGEATLTVSDLTGKVVLTENLSMNNGSADINIEQLDAGVYTFNLMFNNGKVSVINVVKQ